MKHLLKIEVFTQEWGSYLKALQAKEIDITVVWPPFCAQGLVGGLIVLDTLTP